MTDRPQLSWAEADRLARYGGPGELELAVARGQLDDLRAELGGGLMHWTTPGSSTAGEVARHPGRPELITLDESP